MSTVAIDNLALYLIGTMTLAERQYLAKKVMTPDEINPQRATDDEEQYLDRALENSLQDIAAGRVYSQEQAYQMMDAFVANKVNVHAAV